jgi:hypothetical protein
MTGDARSVIGTSAGAANRYRRTAALDIANGLAGADGDREDALDRAAYQMGRLVGHGFDPSDAGDLLQGGAVRCGLSAIAGGIAEGRSAAAEEVEAEAVREAVESATAAKPSGPATAKSTPGVGRPYIHRRRGCLRYSSRRSPTVEPRSLSE